MVRYPNRGGLQLLSVGYDEGSFGKVGAGVRALGAVADAYIPRS